MPIDLDKFLNELASMMATAAQVEFAATPRSLFLYELVESDSTLPSAPASVLRIYDGETGYVPVNRVMIQCKTIAPKWDAGAGMKHAQALRESLLDAQGRELRMAALTHFRINAIVDLRLPGQIGRDANDRPEIVFNFGAEIVPTG